jgi:hypothetical protein
MPGSVSNAAPASVMPDSLCSAFSRSHQYGLSANDYPDGSNQRRIRTATSRKRWTLGKRLTAAEFSMLIAFYRARRGPTEPFYFYDLVDDPTAVYDPTGVSTTSRYTVRFACAWNESWRIPRGDIALELIEVG